METVELTIIIIIIINELSNEFIKQPFLFIIKQCIIYYKITYNNNNNFDYCYVIKCIINNCIMNNTFIIVAVIIFTILLI